MKKFIRNQVQNYTQTILEILADDESVNISKETGQILLTVLFLQRITLFYKTWGIFDTNYTDIKIRYISDMLNWSTGARLLSMLESDTSNMVALYMPFCYHIGSLLLQIFMVYFRQVLNSSQRKTANRILYFYFSTFHYVILFPSLLFSSRQLICERQLIIQKNITSCGQVSQVVCALILQSLLIYQSFIYTYLYRNVTLPVQNFAKRRKSIHNLNIIAPLSFFQMIFDYPCVLLQQFMSHNVYVLANLIKIAMTLLYFFDALLFKPLEADLNRFLLQISTVLLLNGLLLFVQDIAIITEDELVYCSFIFSPLLSHLIGMIGDKQTLQDRKEDALYWADQVQLYEEQMKRDTSYQLRWIFTIFKHKQICENINCKSHGAINIGDYHSTKLLTQSVILCRLDTLIKSLKNQYEVEQLEDICLNQVAYLSFECNLPLKGYLQLKTFWITNDNSQISVFFRLMSQIIGKDLEQRAQQIQDYIYKKSNEEKQQKILRISDIHQCEEFWDVLKHKILTAIDYKIQFWHQLIKGYRTIDEFAVQTISLSKVIWDIKEKTFSNIKVDPLQLDKKLDHLNSIQLRILSIVHSVVLNDFYGTLDIERKIDEIHQFEKNLQIEIILNQDILEESVIVLTISILQQVGLIVKQNMNASANFFGIQRVQDLDNYRFIQQFMPNIFGERHNDWIQNYLERGHSKLIQSMNTVFYFNHQKFICCANLMLQNVFDKSSDFLMIGCLLKSRRNIEYILTDTYGKIIGVSQDMFRYFDITSLAHFNKYGYLFFWMNEYFERFQSDMEELVQDDGNKITQAKEGYLIVGKPLTELYEDFDKFNKQQQIFARVDYTNTKTLNTGQTSKQKAVSNNNLKSMVENDEEKYTYKGQEIPILNQQNVKNLKGYSQRLMESQTKKAQIGIDNQVHKTLYMKYQLELKEYGSENDKQIIFVYHIYEIKQRDLKCLQDANSQAVSIQSRNDDVFTSMEQEIISSNEQNFIRFNNPVKNKLLRDELIKIILPINEKDSVQQADSRQNVELVYRRVDEIEEYSAENSGYRFRNSVFNKEEIILQQSSIISPRDQNLELIQVYDYDLEKEQSKENNKKSSNKESQEIVRRDLVQFFSQNQKTHQHNDVDVQKSQTSATSDKTQFSIFSIIRVLQYSRNIPIQLKRITMINIVLALLFSSFVLLKIILIQSNIQTLQTQISLIQSPNKFNQINSHFVTYSQMYFLQFFDVVEYGDYEVYRLQEMNDLVRNLMNPIITKSKNDFAIYQERDQLAAVTYKKIQGNEIFLSDATFFQFVSLFNQESYQQYAAIKTGVNKKNFYRPLTGSYTIKLNTLSEMALTKDLLNAVYQTFFQTLVANDDLYLILLLTQIFVLTLVTTLQIPMWMRHFRYQQRILLIFTRVQVREALDQIQRFINIKHFLQNSNNQWKQKNFYQYYFQSKIHLELSNNEKQPRKDAKTGKDNLTSLSTKIQENRLQTIGLHLSIVLVIAIQLVFLIGVYFYTNNVRQQTIPQLQLDMDFVKFKYDFDRLNVLAFIIKTEPIMYAEIQQQNIFKGVKIDDDLTQMETGMIDQLKLIIHDLFEKYDSLYGQILQSSKISDQDKSNLLGLYQNNLCQQSQLDLPFCNYEKGKFKNHQAYPQARLRDNYRQTLIYGMTGLIQNQLKEITSAFSHELKYGVYDPNHQAANKYINSSTFFSLFWSYFIDLYKIFGVFEENVSMAASDILQNDIDSNIIIHLVLCGIIILGCALGLMYALEVSKTNTRAIRQALVNLPLQMLFDQQTANQIKRLGVD